MLTWAVVRLIRCQLFYASYFDIVHKADKDGNMKQRIAKERRRGVVIVKRKDVARFQLITNATDTLEPIEGDAMMGPVALSSMEKLKKRASLSDMPLGTVSATEAKEEDESSPSPADAPPLEVNETPDDIGLYTGEVINEIELECIDEYLRWDVSLDPDDPYHSKKCPDNGEALRTETVLEVVD